MGRLKSHNQRRRREGKERVGGAGAGRFRAALYFPDPPASLLP